MAGEKDARWDAATQIATAAEVMAERIERYSDGDVNVLIIQAQIVERRPRARLS